MSETARTFDTSKKLVFQIGGANTSPEQKNIHPQVDKDVAEQTM